MSDTDEWRQALGEMSEAERDVDEPERFDDDAFVEVERQQREQGVDVDEAAKPEPEMVHVPVTLSIDDDGMASMSFGPAPVDDVVEMINSLTTEEGQDAFTKQILAAVGQWMKQQGGEPQ